MKDILEVEVTPPILMKTLHSSVGGGSLWYCALNQDEYIQILQGLIDRTTKSKVRHSILCYFYSPSFLKIVDKYAFIDLMLNEETSRDTLLFESVMADGIYLFEHELETVIDRLRYGFKESRVVLALPEKEKIIECATFVDGTFVKGSY